MLWKAAFRSSHLVRQKQLAKTVSQTMELINKASSATLGPMGRLVAIESEVHVPRITKDGVTVVKHIQFKGRLENAVASLVKRAADSANRFSGDGTTTTTLLAASIVRVATRLTRYQCNQAGLREGFETAKQIALEFLKEAARKVSTQEELMKVAMIATNGDKPLSELISEALSKSQHVTVEKSNSSERYLEFTSGFKLTRGIPNELLINKIDKIEFNYPVVAVSLKKIMNVKEVLPLLEKAKQMRKQLLLMAPDISESVASMLYYNHSKGVLQCCPIRVPGVANFSEEMLGRIAQMYYSPVGLENVQFEHLGTCIRVLVDEFETNIICKATQETRNAVIYVGGHSQTERLESYDKTIDALNSVRSSQREGVVAGGGITYLRIAQLLHQFKHQNKDVELGVKCISIALKQPIRKLMQLSQIGYLKETEGWEGYDFRSNSYVDMFEAGIVDSATVSRNCIIDSISLAGMLLSLEMGIVQDTQYVESDYSTYRGKYAM